MNRKNIKSLFALLLIMCFLPNCKKTNTAEPVKPLALNQPGHSSEYKPFHTVVTTDYLSELIYQFARTRTRGRALIPRGADPFNYVPTESDKKDILQADLVLYNGLGLEPHFLEIFQEAEKHTRVYDLSQAIPKEKLIASDKYSSGYDPHYFKDPEIWSYVVKFLVKILGEIDPEAGFTYGSIYLRYGESLSLHDQRYMDVWSKALPGDRRYLVTLHDSFAYLGSRYGYQTRSLLAPGESQVNNQNLSQLASYIVKNKIPAVFYEDSFSSEPMEKLQQEVQKRGGQVELTGPLYSYFKGPMGDRLFAYIPSGRLEMQIIYDSLKTEDMKSMPK